METASLHTLFRQPPSGWRVACLIAVFSAWCGLEVWAATVSTHAFGRYEIVLQEGVPVPMGEILGLVRRQTGLPEYPLMLRMQKRQLELSILGPGNRPIRLASTQSTRRTRVRAATTRFIVERAVRQDETLTIQLRHANAPGQIGFAVDLRHLERMLEGER
jgi:hypothetical protein